MDDILKECKNQTHSFTHLTVQMDIPVCPNKRPIYFCMVFSFQNTSTIPTTKKTDAFSKRVL